MQESDSRAACQSTVLSLVQRSRCATTDKLHPHAKQRQSTAALPHCAGAAHAEIHCPLPSAQLLFPRAFTHSPHMLRKALWYHRMWTCNARFCESRGIYGFHPKQLASTSARSALLFLWLGRALYQHKTETPSAYVLRTHLYIKMS